MDRVIEKKFWNTKKLLMIGGSVAVLGLIGASVFLTSGKSKLNVESDRITVSEIYSGEWGGAACNHHLP
jgi:HlyD family secretion protein